MKSLLPLVLILSGCQHGPRIPKVQTVPDAKVTTTVTETTKTDRPVPVYRIVSDVKTRTKTITSDGTNAAPLHDATVKPLIQDVK